MLNSLGNAIAPIFPETMDPGAINLDRVAHVARAEISQKPLSLAAPESGRYMSASEYLLGNGQLSMST